MFSVIVTFSIPVCVLFYWYLTITYDYWKKRNVAFEKPYPFVGTTANRLSLKHHPGMLAQQAYLRHPKEKLIGEFASRRPVLIVKDIDLIKNVLVKDFNYFVDRDGTLKNDWEPLTHHLVFERGDLWRGLRQKLTPTFTLGKMRNMFPLLNEVSRDFQKYLDEITSESEICEFMEVSAKFTTDIIGSCAFGIKMNAIRDDHSPFREMGKKMFDHSLRRVFLFGMNQIFPRVFNFFKMRITTLEMEDFFINLVKSVMQAREYKPSNRHDFIDQLIQLKMEGYLQIENNVKITDELLAAQAFAFFAAGFETSSTTMTLCLYELAKNPEIQKKVAEEIDSVLAKYDQNLTFDALKEMKYLKMVLDETLRFYPPVPILNRVCTDSCTLSDTNIKLDKGILLVIPVYAIHHDPKYYPDPEKFLPERFTAEAEAARIPFTYMPFGEGPRRCVAQRFGFMQTMVGIISVMERFSVYFNDKTVPKIRISPTNLTLCSQDDVYLTIIKRK